MAPEERTPEGKRLVREPLAPAKQHRLEKVFEHATKKLAASTDYEYTTELLNQCVLGDPANTNYVKAYVENLYRKFGNNKKGAPLAAFKERTSRSALKKALAQEQWDDVLEQGLKVLTVNPWDVPTLTAMATASAKCGDWENELYYLRAALTANPKDPDINRLCGVALGERGQFDQAIACWHRVEEARPTDEEALRNISVLTERRARSRGDFGDDDEVAKKLRQRDQQLEEQTHEQKLLKKILAEPNTLANYLELSQYYLNEERYQDSENLLAKAYEISNGDVDIREKWEDSQLRRLRHQVSLTKDPAEKKKLQDQYFQKELEVCKNRVERYPNNLAFRYELGYRYMLTKQYNEAIRELQSAKNDPRRKGVCMLALGQCFQQIKQYRLALSHYDLAIQEIPDRDADNKKKALYVAGRLALHLKNVEVAEKYLTTLAGLDFTYKDVAALLDKIAHMRENPESGGPKESAPQVDHSDAD